VSPVSLSAAEEPVGRYTTLYKISVYIVASNVGPGFIIPSIYACKRIRTGSDKIWKTLHEISVVIRIFLQCIPESPVQLSEVVCLQKLWRVSPIAFQHCTPYKNNPLAYQSGSFSVILKSECRFNYLFTWNKTRLRVIVVPPLTKLSPDRSVYENVISRQSRSSQQPPIVAFDFLLVFYNDLRFIRNH